MKTLGRTTIIYQFASFKGSATGKSNIYIYILKCFLSTRDLSMAGFMTTEKKKAMVEPWDWRKERKN